MNKLRNLINENECQLGTCPGIYELISTEECGAVFGCPGVYELISKEECVMGSCPGVYKKVSKEECGVGACPGVYEGIENDYLVIGSLVENPKDFGLEKKVGKGEVLIRIPKKIIDNVER